MKVLLCGEGPHDIGLPNEWDPRRKEYISLEGWMQPIVRQALGVAPDYAVRVRKDLQFLPKEQARLSLPAGHGAKAFLAKRLAVAGEYDAVIFMADADSPDVRDWRRIVGEIEAGFALLEHAIPSIACVPMAASESWLLADPDAWRTVADYDGSNLPRHPELIWGAHDDPDGDRPHPYFCRICGEAGVPDDRDTRQRIAEAMSLVTARRRCPISMEPFLQRFLAA